MSPTAQNHYADPEDTFSDKVTKLGVIVRYTKKVIEKKRRLGSYLTPGSLVDGGGVWVCLYLPGVLLKKAALMLNTSSGALCTSRYNDWATGWTFRVFSSPVLPDRLWGPPSHSSSWYRRSFRVVEQLGRDVDLHLVIIMEHYLYPPCVPSWHRQGQLHVLRAFSGLWWHLRIND